jgi:glucose 1-dehydrogenase
MTRQLAVELAPYNIRVNTFAPGPINVDRNLWDDPNYRSTWGNMTPLKRTPDPEEMVGPAIFLACSDSSLLGPNFLRGWRLDGVWPRPGSEC